MCGKIMIPDMDWVRKTGPQRQMSPKNVLPSCPMWRRNRSPTSRGPATIAAIVAGRPAPFSAWRCPPPFPGPPAVNKGGPSRPGEHFPGGLGGFILLSLLVHAALFSLPMAPLQEGHQSGRSPVVLLLGTHGAGQSNQTAENSQKTASPKKRRSSPPQPMARRPRPGRKASTQEASVKLAIRLREQEDANHSQASWAEEEKTPLGSEGIKGG